MAVNFVKCPSCGVSNDSVSKTCRKCNQPLARGIQEQQEQQPNVPTQGMLRPGKLVRQINKDFCTICQSQDYAEWEERQQSSGLFAKPTQLVRFRKCKKCGSTWKL